MTSMSAGLLALLVVTVVSCTDQFDEYNTPDHELTAEQVQGNPALLGKAWGQAQHTGMLGLVMYQQCYQLFADIYSQIFATTHPAFQSDRFSENQAWSNNCKRTFYQSPAVQQNFVEDFTADNDMPVENALAKIWRVQMYHRITDFYGPTIYSEFGNGETSVAYDSQESMYMDFFTTLDEAITVLEANTSATPFGNDDLIYQGDVNKWITFANSLRLRLAMRLAYVDEDLAQEEAEKAVAAGVFESNDDQAMMVTTIDSYNWISQWTYIREFTMSATIHSIMVGYDDPRLDAYFSLNNEDEGSGYYGMRNGQPSSVRADRAGTVRDFSYVEKKYWPAHRGAAIGDNPPNRVMNTAEVYFLRAEGALRNWNMGGTAADLYNEGIRSSMTDRRPDLTTAEINDYISSLDTPVSVPSQGVVTGNWYHPDQVDSPPVTDIPVAFGLGSAAGDFEKQLEQIITQKWIATWYDGWELWSERRRTGYPVGYAIIDLAPDAVIERDELMRRLSFVTSEYTSNGAAVETATGILEDESIDFNGDSPATRVWWDRKDIGDYPDPVD